MNIKSLIAEISKTSQIHGSCTETNIDWIEESVSEDGSTISLTFHPKPESHDAAPTTKNICPTCKSWIDPSDLPVKAPVFPFFCAKCSEPIHRETMLNLSLPPHWWARYRSNPARWYDQATRKDHDDPRT